MQGTDLVIVLGSLVPRRIIVVRLGSAWDRDWLGTRLVQYLCWCLLISTDTGMSAVGAECLGSGDQQGSAPPFC